MNAEILCVGTEILLGDIVNTNAAYLAKELARCGIGCYYQTVVGDNPQRLKDSLAHALERSDIVLTTGGLGPTYDDLTKETVAEYFDLKMELNQETMDRLKEVFSKSGRTMTKNNEKQAYMPRSAKVFSNEQGTAPGLAVECNGKIVIMMPGPPREMKAMFEKRVRPYLLSHSNTTLVSHTIHLFGIGESAVEDVMKEYMESHYNPTIAPYAKEGEVQLRVTASDQTREAADERTRSIVQEICDMFPEYVYGIDVDTLQNALVLVLKEKQLTVASAESCTGGLISQRITQISGSSEVFDCGVCTYSNEMKTKLIGVPAEMLKAHGAVSKQVAAAMAEGVRILSGSDIGIATTGIAGPGGGTAQKPVGLVYVAVSSEKYEEVLELHLSRGYENERGLICQLAASNALHLAICAAKKF